MKKILVTGANGQLGKCLQQAATQYPSWEFDFFERESLNITEQKQLEEVFAKGAYDYCINTAAYTQVDQAEKEPEKTFLVNGEAVKNVASICEKNKAVLIHISTDYVFDGSKEGAYVETDEPNPINVYGASKLKGEQYVEKISTRYFIVRASWVYSEFGQNFLKTILRLAKERESLTITTEQKGSPTNAHDLAEMLLKIIEKESKVYGTYHFCNKGAITWYDFAKAIVNQAGFSKTTAIVKTDDYPTFAKRPKNSVLDTTKLQQHLGIQIKYWENALRELINRL